MAVSFNAVGTLQQLREALAEAANFDAAMQLVDAARLNILGTGHFTVHANITPNSPVGQPIVLQRMWSAIPASDPVAGRKTKLPTPWTERLLRKGQAFLSNGDAELQTHFDDHARLIALGIHTILNVPVVEDGRVVATVNVMSASHSFDQTDTHIGEQLALAAQPWVLQQKAAVLQALQLS